MAYLLTELVGISLDDNYVELREGDTVLIETDELVIKQGTIIGYNKSNTKESITVEYCLYEEIEIDVDDILRIEVE
ncbi:hypothetical protein [Globicatella sanguinis]|uniref:hypothetical protein n=1 Tax=Globicatella sanguinis TaxID=13076 RepID=UPI000825557D|nr:hypothetical protein [Globicatella sanguinis]